MSADARGAASLAVVRAMWLQCYGSPHLAPRGIPAPAYGKRLSQSKRRKNNRRAGVRR